MISCWTSQPPIVYSIILINDKQLNEKSVFENVRITLPSCTLCNISAPQTHACVCVVAKSISAVCVKSNGKVARREHSRLLKLTRTHNYVIMIFTLCVCVCVLRSRPEMPWICIYYAMHRYLRVPLMQRKRDDIKCAQTRNLFQPINFRLLATNCCKTASRISADGVCHERTGAKRVKIPLLHYH